MLKRTRALASVAVIAVITGMGAPAWAETLRDALALAYQTNPSLLAQRANQRALEFRSSVWAFRLAMRLVWRRSCASSPPMRKSSRPMAS